MRRTSITLRLLAILLASSLASLVRAESGPTTRAMLDELNRETTALYQQAQTGVYHVQLPQPKWINAYALAAVKHWDRQLDPELRKRLENAPINEIQAAEVAAGPSTRPAEDDTTTLPGQGTYIVVRPHAQAAAAREPVLGGKLEAPPTTEPGFVPNNIGLLLDERGHVLVPLYVEREAVGAEPVKLAGPDGELTSAKFIGSDRQTNLTLLQVEHAAGKPVRLGASRPESGSLVMLLSPTDGSGHLAVWTEGVQESGIVLTTDGQIAGIARHGQFLAGSACKLIVRQLVQYGAVKRATLGVLVTEVRLDEVQKNAPALAGQIAPTHSVMRIDQVISGSAADHAGLKPGDLVLAIAGESVSDLPSFAAGIAARNGPTQLQVARGEKVLAIDVDLQQGR